MENLKVNCKELHTSHRDHIVSLCQDRIDRQLDSFESNPAVTKIEAKIKSELGTTVAKCIESMLPTITEVVSSDIHKFHSGQTAYTDLPAAHAASSSSSESSPYRTIPRA